MPSACCVEGTNRCLSLPFESIYLFLSLLCIHSYRFQCIFLLQVERRSIRRAVDAELKRRFRRGSSRCFARRVERNCHPRVPLLS